MWDWINCHLAARHEYVVWTETNRVFLRCMRCGRRSAGWQVAGSDDPNVRRRAHAGETAHRHSGLIAGALALFGFSLFQR